VWADPGGRPAQSAEGLISPLVTGGASFIGSARVRALVTSGDHTVLRAHLDVGELHSELLGHGTGWLDRIVAEY
jgi:NAD(P)-dependent dehydrogenase (short-subunit alcohol dehydrogenase family)